MSEGSGTTTERLHRAVWKEQPVAYHTELDQDNDRVLDVFVRANDGGVEHKTA